MEQAKNDNKAVDVEEDATKNGSYVPRLNKNHGFLHSIKRNQHQRDQFEKDLKAKQEKQRLEREKERAVETPNKDDRVGLDDDLSEEYTPKIYGSRKNLTEEAPHLSPHSDQTWDHTGWEEMQRDRRRSFGSPAKNSGRGRGRGRYQEQRLSYSPQKQPPPRFSDKNQRNDKNQNSNKQIAPKEEKEKVERKKRDTVQAYVPPRGKYSNTSPIVLILNFEVETGKEPQTLYGDKPNVLAAQFVKMHHMDESFIQVITNQIEVNLQAREDSSNSNENPQEDSNENPQKDSNGKSQEDSKKEQKEEQTNEKKGETK